MTRPVSAAMAAYLKRLAEGRAVRTAMWKRLLVRHSGTITRASAERGFSAPRGSALTRTLGLVDFAADLREGAGQPRLGGPRSTPRGRAP